jgi:lysophospholipase L1-like esterase
VRPGHGGSDAQAQGSGSLDHPHLADGARRHTAAHPARALLALQLARTVPADSHWLASWAAAPQPASGRFALEGFANQTIREIAMLSSSGAAVRIHLSNLYGQRPLVIAAASVAIAGSYGKLITEPRQLTFDGSSYVNIRPGGSVVSDPVVMPVRSLERIAVSLYLPDETGPVTYHNTAEQSAFLGAGNEVLNPSGGWASDTAKSWSVLSGIDTLSPPRYGGTVVALGDSITAGFRSTPNTFGAWPDDLARRLAQLSGPTMAVIDEGISGNRLLHSSPCCGAAAVNRFSGDVLDQAGVRAVLLLEGINDIGFSQDTSARTLPHTDVSAAQIIAADERIITAAHRAGLRIYAGTLTPFKGVDSWTPAGERKREAVNHWILTGGAFDGVVDFASVMAEPDHPEILNPAYDSGDHLHPNNAGYRAMARAVNLAMLTATARSATAATARRIAEATDHSPKPATRQTRFARIAVARK